MIDQRDNLFTIISLLFANDGFSVVTCNIVEDSTISINILKYTQACLVSLSVIWLGSSISKLQKN